MRVDWSTAQARVQNPCTGIFLGHPGELHICSSGGRTDRGKHPNQSPFDIGLPHFWDLTGHLLREAATATSWFKTKRFNNGGRNVVSQRSLLLLNWWGGCRLCVLLLLLRFLLQLCFLSQQRNDFLHLVRLNLDIFLPQQLNHLEQEHTHISNAEKLTQQKKNVILKRWSIIRAKNNKQTTEGSNTEQPKLKNKVQQCRTEK